MPYTELRSRARYFFSNTIVLLKGFPFASVPFPTLHMWDSQAEDVGRRMPYTWTGSPWMGSTSARSKRWPIFLAIRIDWKLSGAIRLMT